MLWEGTSFVERENNTKQNNKSLGERWPDNSLGEMSTLARQLTGCNCQGLCFYGKVGSRENRIPGLSQASQLGEWTWQGHNTAVAHKPLTQVGRRNKD